MRVVLATLILAACGVGTDDSVADCERFTTLEIPPAVAEGSGVWDAAKARMVFWGGDMGTPVDCRAQTSYTGETWAYSPECGAFENLGVSGPLPRGRQAQAHDLVGGRMILHGGRSRVGTSGAYTNYDDTWAFDLAAESWVRVSESGPGARVNHAMVATSESLVIFGGNNSTDGATYTPLGDVWRMDLASGAWTEWTTTNTPEPRLFHGYTVSADANTMWIYGGTANFFGPFLGDLHALDLTTGEWTELHDGSGTAPAPRFWSNLLHDEANNRLLMWAGHDDTDLGNTSELWAFDLAQSTWLRYEVGDLLAGTANGFCDFPADFVDPDLEAPERRNAGLAVMAGDDLLIFGGKSDCGLLNDVWSWNQSRGWETESRSTTGEICLRTSAGTCATMCF